MIEMGTLDLHHSAALNSLENLELLQRRNDLYSEKNFYFGFENSNHSFFDMISTHQAIGIKYGPVFSISQRNTSGCFFELYWIDHAQKKLTTLIRLESTVADASTIKELVPIKFTTSYQSQSPEEELLPARGPSYSLALVLEQLTQGIWPDEETHLRLIDAINYLQKNTTCTVCCSDLRAIQQQQEIKVREPSQDDFVTPFSLTNANSDVTVDSILARNPHTITLRLMEDDYPRVELIIPGTETPLNYVAIFANEQKEVFLKLRDSLTNTKEASAVLKEYCSDEIEVFLSSNSTKKMYTSS